MVCSVLCLAVVELDLRMLVSVSVYWESRALRGYLGGFPSRGLAALFLEKSGIFCFSELLLGGFFVKHWWFL